MTKAKLLLLFMTSIYSLTAQGETESEKCRRLLDSGANEAALPHCTLAAEGGDTSVQMTLAFMYKSGIGIKQDNDKATRLLRKAAQTGSAVAQYELGMLYRTRTDSRQDDVEAYAWVDLAANQGDEIAQKARNKLKREMSVNQLEKAKLLSSKYSKEYAK